MVDTAARFYALTQLLDETRRLWQQSHFIELEQQWHKDYPSLYESILTLSDRDVREFQRNPHAIAKNLIGYFPVLEQLKRLTFFTVNNNKRPFPSRLATGVPGRKWEQIEAFAGCLSNHQEASQVVDWCAGKSHLGRAVATEFKQTLRAIERDKTLCHAGLTLSEGWLAHATFEQCDVLLEPITFSAHEQIVGLHACGDLHRKLVSNWLHSESPHLSFAPCCYHKWLKTPYQPLSKLAQAIDLKLSAEQVQLAVQEWVTASAREQQQSEQMLEIRCAFDVLQRSIRQQDTYLPTPSLPYGILAKGPRAILKQLCDYKQLDIPETIDWDYFLAEGQNRFAKYQRLQLVNHCFRRAIETWLVLDLALVLEEHGAQVTLQLFCDRALSPRNIMITANR